MAQATKREIEKTRMVEEKYMSADGVVLELDQEEVYMLAALLGHGTGGANQYVMNIYRALKVHVDMYGTGVRKYERKMSGMVQVEG